LDIFFYAIDDFSNRGIGIEESIVLPQAWSTATRRTNVCVLPSLKPPELNITPPQKPPVKLSTSVLEASVTTKVSALPLPTPSPKLQHKTSTPRPNRTSPESD